MPSPASRRLRRPAAIRVAGVGLSLVFLYLAGRGIDLSRVRDVLERARVPDVAGAVVCMAGLYALQAARWRRIASRQLSARWSTFLRFVVSSVAVNNVVPGRPGEVLRGWWLAAEAGVPFARAMATVVVDRLADVLVLVAVLAASYPFVDHPAWLRHLTLAAVPLGLATLVALALCRWYVVRSPSFGRRLRTAAQRRWLGRQLASLVRGTAASLHPADAVVVLGLSALAWAAFGLAAWLVSDALGLPVRVSEIVFATAVVNLGVAIPSSPGFVGTYQWLCVATLGMFAIGRDEAFAFSILLQAVWYVPTTLAGLAIGLRSAVRSAGAAQEAMR